ARARRRQHLERFADARRRAEENLEPPPLPLFARQFLQQRIGRGPSFAIRHDPAMITANAPLFPPPLRVRVGGRCRVRGDRPYGACTRTFARADAPAASSTVSR